MYKNILTKLIADADRPYISKYKDGTTILTLPAMGDPYYEVSCNLTTEEADELLSTFNTLEVHYV